MTQQGKELALPSSFEEVKGLAQAFVQSGMFKDTQQIASAIVKIQAGRELGLPPVYSMQNINMIRDRLTSSANTLALLVKSSGRYNYRIKSHDESQCSIDFYEKDSEKWVSVGNSTFTMEDAKRANLIKPDSGWAKFPRAMLFSRAISQGARIYAPDAIGGVYTDEEIRAIPPRPGDSDKVDAGTGEIIEKPPAEIGAQEKPKGEGDPFGKAAREKIEKEQEPTPDAPQADSGEVETQDDSEPEPLPVLDTLTDMQKAVHKEFGLQPNEILKELGVTRWSGVTDTPKECYLRIKAVRE